MGRHLAELRRAVSVLAAMTTLAIVVAAGGQATAIAQPRTAAPGPATPGGRAGNARQAGIAKQAGTTPQAGAAKPTTAAQSIVAGKPIAAARPTVAVLYFDYDGNDEELVALRKGWASLLISELAASESYVLVERGRLEAILAELALNRGGRIERAGALKAARLLGARYMVMGGFFTLKGALHVQARVVDVETGVVMKGVRDQGSADEFLALEGRLAAGLDTALGHVVVTSAAAVPTSAVPARKRPARPARLRAAVAARYGRALDARDRGDTKRARTELQVVVKEQPDFELAAFDLASLAE